MFSSLQYENLRIQHKKLKSKLKKIKSAFTRTHYRIRKSALMSSQMRNKRFYFMHIPKSAGTSVTVWLRSHRLFNVCRHGLWTHLLERDKESLGEYDVFSGHFYTYLQDYLKSDLTTFTFLRHPVERSISYYLHTKRNPTHYFYKRAQELGGFMEFLRDPETSSTIFNFQTRALSMQGNIEDWIAKTGGNGAKPFALEKLIETQIDGYSSNVNLPRAMDCLDNCLFVGLTELMDESLYKLSVAMGIEGKTAPTPHVNAADNKIEHGNLTKAEYKMLLSLIPDDMALYEYAKYLFANKFSLENLKKTALMRA